MTSKETWAQIKSQLDDHSVRTFRRSTVMMLLRALEEAEAANAALRRECMDIEGRRADAEEHLADVMDAAATVVKAYAHGTAHTVDVVDALHRET